MVISIISEGLAEILDNDMKEEGAPRYALTLTHTHTYAVFFKF
jgi:hypothetical protein